MSLAELAQQFLLHRSDFPLLRHHTNHGASFSYLDNAATTHKPQQVIDAISHFYAYENAPIGRGVYTLAEHATTRYEQARHSVKQFIAARDTSEIIFTRGATESINLVASSWALHHIQRGDEIVLTELEHHANLLPWQWIAQQTGALLRFIPLQNDGTLDYASLEHVITHKTKLVAVTHNSNAIGTFVNIATIRTHARRVGAKILIDAAQSIPHYRINVDAIDIDFLAFSGHKMLGPTGIGVLYINKSIHDQMIPYQRGGGMVFDVNRHEARWLPAPQRFEAGTPASAQAIGLAAAIDYLARIDFHALARYESALCARLIEGLRTIPDVRVVGPVEQLRTNGHLVSFVVNTMHAHDVAAYLNQKGICVRAGHHCTQPLAMALGYQATVRASFYLYNTIADVDALVEAVAECAHFARSLL